MNEYQAQASKEYERYQVDLARAWADNIRKSAGRMERAVEDFRELDEACDLLRGMAYSLERVSGGSTSNRYEERLVRAIEKREEARDALADSVAEYAELQVEGIKVFRRLECHPFAYSIMGYKYLANYRVQDVAKAVGLTAPQINVIVRDALAESYALMPHYWRDPLHEAS